VLINGHSLFPVLADQVADIVDPVEPPEHVKIPDNDPALSKRLQNYAANLEVNGLDQSFTSLDAAATLDSVLTMLKPTVSIFGTPRSWKLIEASAEGSPGRSRTYLATYQFGELIWTFDLTLDGKIASVFATPD
jgi:hypothetical protein